MIGFHVSSFNPQQFGNDIGQLAEERMGKTTAVAPGAVLTRDNPLTGAVEEVYSSPFKEQVVMVDGRPYAYTPGTGGATGTQPELPQSALTALQLSKPSRRPFRVLLSHLGSAIRLRTRQLTAFRTAFT